ncbi:hypothetical protein D1646_08515 [Pseudoflavonifractor sp. 60]|uniref:tetratricopeptide repeat protein n=1 Tax=Pseudoflavonifractor sp. 60 TaxID=2304576 RepID=UPI001370D23C|nr:tetratricopeptide repeat protein [Pseudoflavonifractor sp. 60]NBI66857.1 hypothetical protein [Pseudoflavonifractor sp. 60]
MKRLWKIIAIGVCIGLVSVVLQKALHIDRDVFLRWYWVTAAAVVLGAVLVNVVYNVFYQKKMQRLVPLLEAQKPREYIAGVEQLLKTAKGQNLRNILMMNLSAGYIDLKEFDKAIELLEGLSDRGLVGTAVKTVCRLNLCTCYFQTGQGEKALMLYRDSQSIFEPQRIGWAVQRQHRNSGYTGGHPEQGVQPGGAAAGRSAAEVGSSAVPGGISGD